MKGTLTKTCMYAGGAVGSLLALHYEMSLWGFFFVLGVAFAGAVIGAGIKAAVFLRRSRKARIANEARHEVSHMPRK